MDQKPFEGGLDRDFALQIKDIKNIKLCRIIMMPPVGADIFKAGRYQLDTTDEPNVSCDLYPVGMLHLEKI